jgi:hypothetical protein
MALPDLELVFVELFDQGVVFDDLGLGIVFKF